MVCSKYLVLEAHSLKQKLKETKEAISLFTPARSLGLVKDQIA